MSSSLAGIIPAPFCQHPVHLLKQVINRLRHPTALAPVPLPATPNGATLSPHYGNIGGAQSAARSANAWRRRGEALILLLLFSLVVSRPVSAAEAIAAITSVIRWGEPSRELLAHFGARARIVPSPIDFGDSYSNVVLRDVAVGGIPLIAFFQMDKARQGLKRIQLERQRHGVNAAAFRGVLAGLEAEYGVPDALCGVRPGPAGGYQAAAERIWRRDGIIIHAIFRDTSIEAFEGCLSGDPSLAGPCGLTGQLLIRLSPAEQKEPMCASSKLGRRMG
jgi:hypothetical protein